MSTRVGKVNKKIIWIFCLIFGQYMGMTECSLLQLGEMIKTKTGRSWTDYSDYGHWCGFGGHDQPVDAVDMCCKTHDHCYDSLGDKGCGNDYLVMAYTKHYTWWLHIKDKDIVCSNNSICSQAICECDRGLAQCLRRTDIQYDRRQSGMMYKHLFSGLKKI